MDVQSAYDAVASAYAARFHDDLGLKPFDARMLDWLAVRVESVGPICDMGSGPGQVAGYQVGEGPTRVDEFLGAAVSLEFHFFQPAVLRRQLTDAGLHVTEVVERDPYGEHVEAPTRRAYLFAAKRGATTGGGPDELRAAAPARGTRP